MEQEDTTLNDAASEDNNTSNETNSEGAGDEQETKTFSQSDLDSAVKDARKGQDKIWKEERIPGLLKGKEGSDESGNEDKEDHTEATGSVTREEFDRQVLATASIHDDKEQDIVLDHAKKYGISALEASKKTGVKAELKEMRAANSTPSPSQRSGTGIKDELAHDVAMMNKGERLPTPERRSAARKYLAKTQ